MVFFFKGSGAFFFWDSFVTLGVGGGNENEFTVKWGLDLRYREYNPDFHIANELFQSFTCLLF